NPVSGCIFTPRPGAPCTDDGNPCTSDVCGGGNVCTHPNKPDTTPCNEGAFCTLNASCHTGICLGTPLNCDDGNPCTTDSCDEPDRTCVHAPLAACSTTTTVTTTTSSTASTAPTTSSTSTSTSTTRSTSSTAPSTTSSSSTSTSHTTSSTS